MKTSKPGFSKPTELSTPHSVSYIRGGGFPALGFKVIVLVVIAPILLKSVRPRNSSPKPNVPEAQTTGVVRFKPPRLIFIFIFFIFPISSLAKQIKETIQIFSLAADQESFAQTERQ